MLELSLVTTEKATNKVDKGERGIYDKRNRLNDLTGKEWLSLSASVWSSKTEMDKIGKQHPAPFSHNDIEKLISLFTKKNMTVLDPMAGVASTLIACGNLKRKGIGIDLNKDYVDLSKKRLKEFNITGQKLIVGNALKKIKTVGKIDYCVTSPPYHNILRKKGDGVRHDGSQSRQGVDYYSEKKNDLGNQKSYDDYLHFLKEMMKEVYDRLRDAKYCSIVISDFTIDKKETDVSGDIIKLMQEINFIFKGKIILNQNQKSIYPFGYPYDYVINHTNQFILNFKKPKKD